MDQTVKDQLPAALNDPLAFNWNKVLTKKRKLRENGLKHLTPLHKHIITYHSRGISHREIAAILQVTEQECSIVIRDPLAQAELKLLYEGYEQELIALLPVAIEAIRSGLLNNDVKLALNAADKLFKATGRYGRPISGQDTAEDVIQRVLATVAVNNSEALRNVTAESRRDESIGNLIDVTPNKEVD